ncbi:MAG: V-type ATP synthase subunit I [Lachnospiraceae bacterium]
MIEKMKFINITGPKADIDRVTSQYLSKYEIHLEHTLSELKTVSNLMPYIESSPYKAQLQASDDLVKAFEDRLPRKAVKSLSIEESIHTVQTLNEAWQQSNAKRNELQKQLEPLLTSKNKIAPFKNLNYDVSCILHFKHIRFRFGRIPPDQYHLFMDQVYSTVDTIIHKCQEDDSYVWIVYFTPKSLSKKIDAMFASLHFERFIVPDEYDGTPSQAAHALDDKIDQLRRQIAELDQQMSDTIARHSDDLVAAHTQLKTLSTTFNIRNLAACTNHPEHPFYILCGWMQESDARSFQAELAGDSNTFCTVEDDNVHSKVSKPPTKLRNPGLFRPFETFLKMYGLPSYGEIDPTIIMGLSYAILFGFMFGDVGQGLCLMLGGLLIYRARKLDLAAIISCCGFFSTIFGFLFGSVFGFEHVLDAVWLRPKEAMIQLPFIGSLNTVFVVAIALGMGIILLTMILNVINSLRNHDPEKAFFDTNGIAGIVFYGAITVTIALYMTGRPLPATAVLILMFVLPLAVIFFKEPLTAAVEKKAEVMPTEKGMFLVQGFFELFEILLSYFSNTLSFVRVGAFAVSHAAMMEVVLLLAGAESGSTNWLIIILGNLFVCGMEGLIVGIQVLRLEYYELFSRFYHGSGRVFTPYGK